MANLKYHSQIFSISKILKDLNDHQDIILSVIRLEV